MRAQSAMEYLMTYGWAILIIAIVLAALFQLGVFSSSTFAPKASPDSCQVFRPNGPGTTQFINTEGVCNGELPQYVAQFNAQSQISTTASLTDNVSSVFTVSYWFSQTQLFTASYTNMLIISNMYSTFLYSPGNLAWSGFPGRTIGISVLSLRKWYNVVAVDNGTACESYLDGVIAGGIWGCTPASPSARTICIGCNAFVGSISNLQVYNTSLSQPEITALYQEGIGGAPIDLQNLVGWWPLNGNAHDYSGNNNNGQTNGGVAFTANWENGYTQP